MPKTRLTEARDLMARGDYRSAHTLCMAVIQAAPDAGEPYFLLGVLAADHANHIKAIDLFDRAQALGADAAEVLAFKARSLVALNRRDEAIKLAREAAVKTPSRASTLDTIGVVFSRAGLHKEALPFYDEATVKAPRSAHLQYNRAVALQFVGRMDDARDAYERCLELDEKDTRALTGLVQVSRQTDTANHLDRLKAAYQELAGKSPADVADPLLHVCHAIAKTLEDTGQAQKAMDWYARGKTCKLATLDYDFDNDRALFDAAMDTARFGNASGGSDEQPVFIVGMPRTGTTLVDRILSSHSGLRSAGELSDFALCLKRQLGTPSRYVLDAETLRAAANADLNTLGADYVRQVRDTLGVAGRFIDKMPLNAFYVPLILKALPEARIICLRRHPLDTILSNYRQLFATSFSYYNYALNLETAARYYAAFDRMVSVFRQTLPDHQFTEVHYEDVVTDIEAQTRRLLEFCGLEFEPSCLAFHENSAPVATASSVQVRSPLYASSIGRWQKVSQTLKPAIDILLETGILPVNPAELGPTVQS